MQKIKKAVATIKSVFLLRPWLVMSCFLLASIGLWMFLYYNEQEKQSKIEIEDRLNWMLSRSLNLISSDEIDVIQKYVSATQTIDETKLESIRSRVTQFIKGDKSYSLLFFVPVQQEKIALWDVKTSRIEINHPKLQRAFEKLEEGLSTEYLKSVGQKYRLTRIVRDNKGYPILGVELSQSTPWSLQLLRRLVNYPSLMTYLFLVLFSMVTYFYLKHIFVRDLSTLKLEIDKNLDKLETMTSFRDRYFDVDLIHSLNRLVQHFQYVRNQLTDKIKSLAEKNNRYLIQQGVREKIERSLSHKEYHYWFVYSSLLEFKPEFSFINVLLMDKDKALFSYLDESIRRFKEHRGPIPKFGNFVLEIEEVKAGADTYFVAGLRKDSDEKYLRQENENLKRLVCLYEAKVSSWVAYSVQLFVAKKMFERVNQATTVYEPEKVHHQAIALKRLTYWIKEFSLDEMFLGQRIADLVDLKVIEQIEGKAAFEIRFIYDSIQRNKAKLEPLLAKLELMSHLSSEAFLFSLDEILGWLQLRYSSKVALKTTSKDKPYFSLATSYIFYLINDLVFELLGHADRHSDEKVVIEFEKSEQGWLLLTFKKNLTVPLMAEWRNELRSLGELVQPDKSNQGFWEWMFRNPLLIDKLGKVNLAFDLVELTSLMEMSRVFFDIKTDASQMKIDLVITQPSHLQSINVKSSTVLWS